MGTDDTDASPNPNPTADVADDDADEDKSASIVVDSADVDTSGVGLLGTMYLYNSPNSVCSHPTTTLLRGWVEKGGTVSRLR